MKEADFLSQKLTRNEMKSIRGGNVPLPNTYLCDCGPNTMMDVYGTDIGEALSNYRMAMAPSGCSSPASIRCVPDEEDPT